MNTSVPEKKKNVHLPAVLWRIQSQEVHAGKGARQGIKVRCQPRWKLTPGSEKQHNRALGAVGIQELHQVLNKLTNTSINYRIIFLEFICMYDVF